MREGEGVEEGWNAYGAYVCQNRDPEVEHDNEEWKSKPSQNNNRGEDCKNNAD